MDVERALNSKILEDRVLVPVHEAGVTRDFFIDEENRKVWDWINDYWRDEGSVPTTRALQHAYPTYRVDTDVEESLDWLIDQIRKQRKRDLVIEILAETGDALSSRDGEEEALRLLSAGLSEIHTEIPVLADEHLTETYSARAERYRELAESTGELAGLPTSFPAIDRATNGLQPEQLVTLIGQAKAGKSWIAIRIAKAVSDIGLLPMFVSFEMSVAEQAARFDAMCLECSATNLMAGHSTPHQRKRLKRLWRERRSENRDVLISSDINAVTTLSGLAAKIETNRPDLVIVDGAYLMDDEHSDSRTSESERLTRLTRGLKRLAQQRKVPVLATTQALQSKTRRGRLDQNSGGYTSSFQQDSDVLLGVEKPEDEDSRMVVRVIASRNSGKVDIGVEVDWDTSRFIETGEETREEEFG